MARDVNLTASSARPLRWWTPGVLNTLAIQVAPVWSRWAQDWGVEVAAVQAFNASEIPATLSSSVQWQAVGTGRENPTACLWAGVPSGDPCTMLADVLWGTSTLDERQGTHTLPSTLAADTADKAWKALLGELASLLKIATAAADGVAESPASVPDHDLKPWSGAIQLELRFAGLSEAASVWLHLSPTLAQAHCSTQRPAARPAPASKTRLIPLKEAMASQPLRFSVELDPTELSLGDLQSLRVGDVLALTHRLDSPLTLRSQRTIADGSATEAVGVCLAYLGAQQGQRAIEILRTDSEFA